MAELYLHIGMPKTGTSYIQSFLSLNPEPLSKSGCVYPDFGVYFERTGKLRNAHFLAAQIFDETGERDKAAEKKLFDNCFDTISQLALNNEKIVISDECLWNSAERYGGDDFWLRIREESVKRGLELKIIVYLRRQDLFMQSFWAQHVKEFSTLSFEDYSKKRMNKIRLDYAERLDRLSDCLGKENIIVRVYEKQQFAGARHNLISDFFDAIGVELTEEYQKPEKPVNASLSGIYLETKRLMNRFPEYREKANYLSRLLKEAQENNGGTASYNNIQLFSYDELVEYLSKYQQTNRQVAQRYLGREDGVLFRDEIKKEKDSPKANYSLNDCLQVMRQVLTLQEQKNQENNLLIAQLKATVKQQESTINWISASFPKKVLRKIKNTFRKLLTK